MGQVVQVVERTVPSSELIKYRRSIDRSLARSLAFAAITTATDSIDCFGKGRTRRSIAELGCRYLLLTVNEADRDRSPFCTSYMVSSKSLDSFRLMPLRDNDGGHEASACSVCPFALLARHAPPQAAADVFWIPSLCRFKARYHVATSRRR